MAGEIHPADTADPRVSGLFPGTPWPRPEWQLRTRSVRAGRLPLVMGIVNVTPDSFSDGGRYFDAAAAVEHGLRLAAEGADLLDVGGESTRPGAAPVDTDEELRRVVPVVEALARRAGVPVSIDTRKARVAREALAAGAEAVNDVSGFEGDPDMLAVVAEARCGALAMHMQGEPRTMQRAPRYGDVVGEVIAYLRSRRDALVAAGIDAARIALDPGIGFGKTLAHNLALLRSVGRMCRLGRPVVIGHSRKRWIGELLGDLEADRTAGTLAASIYLAGQGADVLRVHDVASVRQAVLLFDALAQ